MGGERISRWLKLNDATTSSPPPCGEGSGVGVGRCRKSVPHGTTPHPNPPPQGGRESQAARTSLNLTRMRVAPTARPWRRATRTALPAPDCGAARTGRLHPIRLQAVCDHAAKLRLLGAFSHVGLSIDDLQIRQAPEAEQ